MITDSEWSIEIVEHLTNIQVTVGLSTFGPVHIPHVTADTFVRALTLAMFRAIGSSHS